MSDLLRMTVLCLILAGSAAASCEAATRDDANRERASSLFQNQQWAEAAAAYEPVVAEAGATGVDWYRYGYALHAAGKYEQAKAAHAQAAKFAPFKTRGLYNLACAQALLGESAAALKSLEAALDAGFRSPTPIGDDPDFKSLRDLPEFQALAERAKPISQQPQYRQFDFWLGSWDVFNPQGQQVGHNEITSEEQGFVVREKWTSGLGGSGQSLNFFDPADNLWKQIWVDTSGSVTRYQGSWEEGAMRFEGVSHLVDGRREDARMTFTPQADSSVRQFIERSVDGKKTWSVYFDGIYRKAAK